jgi:trehalose-6-phosphatase
MSVICGDHIKDQDAFVVVSHHGHIKGEIITQPQ